PIPRKTLTVDRLDRALSAATSDAAMRERAAALGEGIRSEDGITAAAEAISAAGSRPRPNQRGGR
ncbi:MAG TPA: hypothetical protein VNT60_09395, partial [Deinococcales bacterium]|nr:hypothetical protein [Deinococcales bacterium]